MTQYYGDPAGSNTAPYDTWAKAATSLQTLLDTAVAGDDCDCRGTFTLAASLDVDTNAGSAASGFISFYGCDAGGTRGAGQCVIDANSAATNCLAIVNKSYYRFHNFTFQNSTGDLIDGTASSFWELKQCIFQNAGADGIGYRMLTDARFIQCKFLNNTGAGTDDTSVYSNRFYFCLFAGNARGSDSRYTPLYIGCVFRDNTNEGIVDTGTTFSLLIMSCVFDGNGGNNVDIAEGFFFGNRITNSTGGYGAVSSKQTYYEDYCVYYNNNLGERSGVTSGANSADAVNTTEQGYTDVANNDFNLTTNAIVRSEALAVDW